MKFESKKKSKTFRTVHRLTTMRATFICEFNKKKKKKNMKVAKEKSPCRRYRKAIDKWEWERINKKCVRKR